MPKNWSPEKAVAEEKLRLETIEKQKAKQKVREEQAKKRVKKKNNGKVGDNFKIIQQN